MPIKRSLHSIFQGIQIIWNKSLNLSKCLHILRGPIKRGKRVESSYLQRFFAPGPPLCHTYSKGDLLQSLLCSMTRSANFLISENIHTDDVKHVRNTISRSVSASVWKIFCNGGK